MVRSSTAFGKAVDRSRLSRYSLGGFDQVVSAVPRAARFLPLTARSVFRLASANAAAVGVAIIASRPTFAHNILGSMTRLSGLVRPDFKLELLLARPRM